MATTPVTNMTPSNGSNFANPGWVMAVMCAVALLSAFGSVYWATHDTPERRAANEAMYLTNQGKETELEMKKEETKQMKIAARTGGVLQPLILSSPRQTVETRHREFVGSEGQHFLARGMDFVFNGTAQDDKPSATIAFRKPPVSTTGAFMIYAMGKTAWNEAWSTAPSPYPLGQLLAETISVEGDVKYLWIYSRGETIFNM